MLSKEKTIAILNNFYSSHEMGDPSATVITNISSWVKHQPNIEDEQTLAALAMSGSFERCLAPSEIELIKKFFLHDINE